MGILGDLVGGIVGQGIGKTAEGIASAIDRFVETDEEKAAADLLVKKIQLEPAKWQAEINKIEAGHRTIFVAGWRPFIGWICGVGIGWHFIGYPVAQFVCAVMANPVALPSISASELITLVISLLGLGTMRTWEKGQGLSG